jgi:hypothetical protein
MSQLTMMATWQEGLFTLAGGELRHEFAGQEVRGLTRDRRGGALAIVARRTLYRRTPEGEWHRVATSSTDLSCCAELDDAIYSGTDDARVLRIAGEGALQPLSAFDRVAGRDQWYAGTAVVNGQLIGPPLGVRSMTVTGDGAVLLVNVHVGGIPRSSDRGETWHPTIDVGVDVHDVFAHPSRPNLAIAAAAAGLCVSRDAGATWTLEQQGMHAAYCSAVAFAGDDILVAASDGHFAPQGALYRRAIADDGPLRPVEGLPRWLDGICDTDCVDVLGPAIALVDRAGTLYLSDDLGRSWSRFATGHRSPSSVAIL